MKRISSRALTAAQDALLQLVEQSVSLIEKDIDVFIENIFNFPILAKAYRVAALQIAGHRLWRVFCYPGYFTSLEGISRHGNDKIVASVFNTNLVGNP